MPKCIT